MFLTLHFKGQGTCNAFWKDVEMLVADVREAGQCSGSDLGSGARWLELILGFLMLCGYERVT